MSTLPRHLAMHSSTTKDSPMRAPDRRREYAAVAGVYLLLRLVALAGLSVFATANGSDLGARLFAWDARWMVDIAQQGYFGLGEIEEEPGHWQSLAFFPAFPFLIGALSQIPGVDPAVIGSVIAAGSGLALAFAVVELARIAGAGPRGRIAASILVTTAPMSIVFLMPYTDGPFLAMAAWALVLMIRKRWLGAGVLVFIAGLTRPTAIALFLTFAMVVLVHDRRNWKAWLAVAVSPAGWVGYLMWASSHLREVGGWFGAQSRGWNTGVDGGLATVRFLIETLTTSRETGYTISAFIVIAVVVPLVLASLPVMLRLWGNAWPVLLFSWVVAAQILLSDGLMHSRPRLLLASALVLIVFCLMIREESHKRSATSPVVGWVPRGVGVGKLVGWIVLGNWVGWYMLTAFEWAI